MPLKDKEKDLKFKIVLTSLDVSLRIQIVSIWKPILHLIKGGSTILPVRRVPPPQIHPPVLVLSSHSPLSGVPVLRHNLVSNNQPQPFVLRPRDLREMPLVRSQLIRGQLPLLGAGLSRDVNPLPSVPHGQPVVPRPQEVGVSRQVIRTQPEGDGGAMFAVVKVTEAVAMVIAEIDVLVPAVEHERSAELSSNQSGLPVKSHEHGAVQQAVPLLVVHVEHVHLGTTWRNEKPFVNRMLF